MGGAARIWREAALTALTAVTVWVALWSWHSWAAGMSHTLVPLTLGAIAVAAAGAVMRLARAPRTVTVVVQLALAWSVVSIRLTHSPVPVAGAARLRLEDAFLDAGNAAERYAPPVPVTHGILPFVLCGAALAFVVADVLARTLHRPALVGLALLGVLAVPFSVVGGGVSAWTFALTAAGFLALVVAEEATRATRWGRPLGDMAAYDDRDRRGWRSTLGAAAVGTTATALALVVPLGIPTLHLDLGGIGGGGGGSHVTVTNPMVDLHRDLAQGRDVPLLRVRTADPDPTYLRIAVLSRFTDTEWTAGDRAIPRDQDASGSVPMPGIDSAIDRSDFDYAITADPNFDSRWLPTPTPIDEIEAAGDWRYDTDTMDFVAAAEGLSTAGLSYRATKEELDLDSSALTAAGVGVGQVPAMYTELPPDLSSIVATLAREVTKGYTDPFLEAVALQNWFRSTGGFHYSTETDLGSGTDDLTRFLTAGRGGRTGYCQQFAAAMAVMARTLGIPARVAVGFLSPELEPDGSYVYSSHDMHAWPELYLAGAGWVRFEPTPAVRGTSTPAYTRHLPVENSNPSAGHPADEHPITRPQPSRGADPTQHQPASADAATAHHAEHHPLLWLLAVPVGAIVVALLALPRTVRRRRRARRLAGGPEQAWAEVRHTALDLRIPWADGASPRASGRMLSTYVATREGNAALERLVVAVERARYAREGGSEDVATDAGLVVTGLFEGAPGDLVRRATWLPRSLLRVETGITDAAAADSPDHTLTRIRD